MTGDAALAAILAEIAAAFEVGRPGWFVNAAHCCECAEHEASLQAHDLDSLDLECVGSPAWDPITFISNPERFRYYLPALARLACGDGDQYYLDSFCFQLTQERIGAFDERQKASLEALLYHLAESHAAEIEAFDDFHELEWTLRRLTGEPGPASYEGQG